MPDMELHNIQSGPVTVLGAGVYVFGENIPHGAYDLRAISGSGWLSSFDHEGHYVANLSFGTKRGDAKTYRGIDSSVIAKFQVQDDVEFEIRKSQMIEIL